MAVEFGILLPTREAVMSGRPETAPMLAMADSDVMVNLSRAEAFSVAVLESLAVGTPVVASTSTALREWSVRFPHEVGLVVDIGQGGVALQ